MASLCRGDICLCGHFDVVAFPRFYLTTFFYVSSHSLRRYVFIYGYSLKLRNIYAKVYAKVTHVTIV